MPEPAGKRLVWDETGKKIYESGVDRGVLYPESAGTYPLGVVWNGLTAVNEKSSGAESNPQWADNIKYLDLYSNEEFAATIEAFTYPDEFAECDGSKEVIPGVFAGAQRRKPFGFSYRSKIGNDTEDLDYGYNVHVVYGCKAGPSEKNRNTTNDSPEAMTFSWEVTTTPVEVVGHKEIKPTAHLKFNSIKIGEAGMAALENVLYGSAEANAKLPLPKELIDIVQKAAAAAAEAKAKPETADVTVG